MRHGSLFSGIGGFDLAAEWCGWENVFHCEWNTFGQKVLTHHFPKSISYNDITKQILLFTEDTSTSLVEASLVNPTQVQESDLAKKMRDTSGRKCLEQLGKFSRVGLWARTFADLLIGTGDWYSTRCNLTWKLKATKCFRFYFQLVPSMHPHRRDRIWFVSYNASYTNKIRLQSKMEDGELGRELRFTKCNKRNIWDSFPIFLPNL